jgi:hypothetical protein
MSGTYESFKWLVPAEARRQSFETFFHDSSMFRFVADLFA